VWSMEGSAQIDELYIYYSKPYVHTCIVWSPSLDSVDTNVGYRIYNLNNIVVLESEYDGERIDSGQECVTSEISRIVFDSTVPNSGVLFQIKRKGVSVRLTCVNCEQPAILDPLGNIFVDLGLCGSDLFETGCEIVINSDFEPKIWTTDCCETMHVASPQNPDIYNLTRYSGRMFCCIQ